MPEYENKWEEIETHWKGVEKKLGEAHDKEVKNINEFHDWMKDKFEKRLLAYDKESQHGGVELESRNLTANEQERKSRLADENDQYSRKVGAIEKELSQVAFKAEGFQAERNDLDERHRKERDAYEQFRAESDKKPDITPEKRLADWLQTYGPVAEKVWNTAIDIASMHPHAPPNLNEYKIPPGIDYKNAGQALEVATFALRVAGPESIQPYLLTSKQVDQLIMSGVDQVQTRERDALDAMHAQQLGDRAKLMEQNIQRDLQKDLQRDIPRQPERPL